MNKIYRSLNMEVSNDALGNQKPLDSILQVPPL